MLIIELTGLAEQFFNQLILPKLNKSVKYTTNNELIWHSSFLHMHENIAYCLAIDSRSMHLPFVPSLYILHGTRMLRWGSFILSTFNKKKNTRFEPLQLLIRSTPSDSFYLSFWTALLKLRIVCSYPFAPVKLPRRTSIYAICKTGMTMCGDKYSDFFWFEPSDN
jgi:hypothetical protein